MFQVRDVEKIKIYILCSRTFPKIVPCMTYGEKWLCSPAGHRSQ